MKTLCIQYQIVKELRRRNLRRDYPERKEFFLSLSEHTFAQGLDRNELYLALDDIIGSNPSEHYIDYREDQKGTKERKRLAVTKKGRKFIRGPFGFLEELAQIYPYTLSHLAALLIGLITGWLLSQYGM